MPAGKHPQGQTGHVLKAESDDLGRRGAGVTQRQVSAGAIAGAYLLKVPSLVGAVPTF